MSATATEPEFTAIYFDSNILIGHRWPTARPELHNLLQLAQWWEIATFFPDPVIQEVEAHWRRAFESAESQLQTARRKLAKTTFPTNVDVTAVHATSQTVLEQWREASAAVVAQLGIRHVAFTTRSIQEVFGYATRYVRPFALDGEGKGFQDTVIMLSVLDHLRDQTGTRGVLVTEDDDFKSLSYEIFDSTFEPTRLRILNLKTAFDELFHPYFAHTRIQPYLALREAAEEKVRARMDELRDFVSSRLTPEMFHPSFGETIIRILEVAKVEVRRVDLPFPEEAPTNLTVDVTIRLAITCKVVVSTDPAAFRWFLGEVSAPATPPTEREKTAVTLGVIQASGAVVEGKLTELRLSDLARDDF